MPHHEIPLSRPDITDLEVDMVSETLRSGRLALGPMAERFENQVDAPAGCKHAKAV